MRDLIEISDEHDIANRLFSGDHPAVIIAAAGADGEKPEIRNLLNQRQIILMALFICDDDDLTKPEPQIEAAGEFPEGAKRLAGRRKVRKADRDQNIFARPGAVRSGLAFASSMRITHQFRRGHKPFKRRANARDSFGRALHLD